jgi:GT2 family glycosyltransferase
LLIRRTVVERIGLLDERFFLYSEELDWCHAARVDGWRVLAMPDEIVVHHRGASTQQQAEEALSRLVETRLAYFHKRHGLIQASIVAVAYSVGNVRRLAHDRQRARAKLRGIGRWMRGAAAFGRRSRHASRSQG